MIESETRDHAAHFQSRHQQEQAASLGMWIFVSSETLLFAGLFGLYTAYRLQYPHEFEQASAHNMAGVGTIMTVILLVSSFFVAYAVDAVRRGHPRSGVVALWSTVALGVAFFALKAYEYHDHMAHGIYPGSHYRFDELSTDGANVFFTLYYFLTGLHALHVIAGMVVIGVLAVLVRRGRFSPTQHVAVENGGLYWHLVDVIWIFLWPLLYLIG